MKKEIIKKITQSESEKHPMLLHLHAHIVNCIKIIKEKNNNKEGNIGSKV